MFTRMLSALRSRRLWLGLLGTVLFLGLFFWRTDLGELADALGQANYWWAIPAVALWFLSAGFRSLRWHYLLRGVRSLATGSLYPVVIIGYMANNLLPLRTGELVRAYVLGERHGVSKMSALGTIAVERLFDGLVLVTFLVLVGAFVGLDSTLRLLAASTAVLFSLGFAAFLWLASSRPRADRFIDSLLRLAPQRLRQPGHEWASAFVEGLASLQRPSLAAAVLGISVLAWLLEALMYYLVGLSFDIGEAFPTYLMVAGAANLAISLPSTSGGIGPFELLARETLTFVGVSSSLASAYAIALHGLLVLPVIAAGLLFLWGINLSLGQALVRPRPEPEPRLVGEQVE